MMRKRGDISFFVLNSYIQTVQYELMFKYKQNKPTVQTQKLKVALHLGETSEESKM